MPALPAIRIDDSLIAAWPETHLGCIAYEVRVRQRNPELWRYYEDGPAAALRDKLATTPLADMPMLGAARAAYKAFGADPRRNRISSEALYRRLRQGKALYQINSLVDANNLLSIETGFSLGSYDTARIGPDLVFRLGGPGESYAGIGKAAIALANLPLLADDAGPFGGPTSDSERAMITGATTRGLTVIYSFSGKDALLPALALAERQLTRFAQVENARSMVVGSAG